MAQSSVARILATVAASQLDETVGASTSSPSQLAPDISTYSVPPAPLNILATAISAATGLLAAVRDSSDLFLPLKATAIGVVALREIRDVCFSTPLHRTR